MLVLKLSMSHEGVLIRSHKSGLRLPNDPCQWTTLTKSRYEDVTISYLGVACTAVYLTSSSTLTKRIQALE